MIARTGRKISEIYDDLWNQYGHSVFMADNYSFRPELKDAFMHRIMTEKQLPELPYETDHVSYMDGCKVYFKNGGWVSVRFSGTEPLLRIFCELPEGEDTAEVSRIWRDFLGIA
jgi:phosphomannomutase